MRLLLGERTPSRLARLAPDPARAMERFVAKSRGRARRRDRRAERGPRPARLIRERLRADTSAGFHLRARRAIASPAKRLSIKINCLRPRFMES
jgi:hypothetical protein